MSEASGMSSRKETEAPPGIESMASYDSAASSIPPPPPPLPPSDSFLESNDDGSSVSSPPPPPLSPPPERVDDESAEDDGPSLRLSELTTPAFVINRHAFAKNCRIVSESAKKRALALRPHVKTHKTVEGAWVQAHGLPFEDEEPMNSATVTGFVASTIPEVAMLVSAAKDFGGPFADILYGVPISASKLVSIHKMTLELHKESSSRGNIHIFIDHPHQVDFVEDFSKMLSNPMPFSVFLKLDTGYHRAGISCDEQGIRLAERIVTSPHLKLFGVYSHCGHAYKTNKLKELDDIAKADIYQISSFLSALQVHMDSIKVADNEAFSIDDLSVSVGSTPSLFHHHNVNDELLVPNMKLEIHPGNYTFYDRQQLWTGACKDESDCAGRVLARVIGHYEDRNTIMLDAGATALTKDTTPQGGMCAIYGHPELECFQMSQEVLLVRPVDITTPFPFEKLPLGSLVNLIPNHSCLAAACFDKYHVIDDPSCSFAPDEVVVEQWIPARGFT